MDFDRYVGIPWQEHACGHGSSNCWGLVRLIYRECRGIELPSYSEEYVTEEDSAEIAALIDGQRDTWDVVAQGQEQLFDVAVLRARGRKHADHVGLVIGNKQMLHVATGHASRVERYAGFGVGHRIDGFYRYRG